MGTYRELQDRICLDYLNRSDLYAPAKRAIQNAIKTYEGHRYWFNETSTAVATVANQSYLAVPGDFLAVDRLEVFYSGGFQKLLFVPFDEVRTMNAVSATSVPTHFAYRGDRFELALIPDSAYTATCYYLQTLAALSADADTNAWTTEGQNLIAHAATVDLLVSVLHVEDDNRVARHEALVAQAWSEFYKRNSVRAPTRLKPTKF